MSPRIRQLLVVRFPCRFICDPLKMVQCYDLLAALADSVLKAWVRLSLQQAFLKDVSCQCLGLLDFEVAEELLSIRVSTSLSFLKDRFDLVEVLCLLVDGGTVREHARRMCQSADIHLA